MNRDFLGASGSARGRLTLNETTILMGTGEPRHTQSVPRGALRFLPQHCDPRLPDRESEPESRTSVGPRVGPAPHRGASFGHGQRLPQLHRRLHLRRDHRGCARPLSGHRVPAVGRGLSGVRSRGPPGGRFRRSRGPMLPTWMRGSPRPGNTSRGSPRSAAPWNSRSPAGDYRFSSRLRWAARMDRLYVGETPTDGFGVLNLTASRAFVGLLGDHTISNISLELFNVTNALARPPHAPAEGVDARDRPGTPDQLFPRILLTFRPRVERIGRGAPDRNDGRRFAPAIETPLRACGARRRVPIGHC